MLEMLKSVIIKTASALIPAAVPPCHIFLLYYFWREYGRRVNRQYCSCSCWDTIFKGTYESGIASYKHLYFNATSNTAKMWIVTVVCIIVLYESWKHVLSLLFKGRLRFLMLTLFVASLFSHYYAWWVYINYWNDDFYEQWNHQLFFTITEMISTTVVLYLADIKVEISTTKVLIIISVATMHILCSGVDQFLKNVVLGEGLTHQIIRDLAFMIPDILHVVIPLFELHKANQMSKKPSSRYFKLTNVCAIISFIILGFIVTNSL